jgi:ABC transport system ATP-binding/permease protein
MGEDQFFVMRAKNYNENLANVVLNRLATNKIYDADNKLIQKADPIFMAPGSKLGRAHFFAPYKQLGNLKIGTLIFNMIAVWIMISGLFITLYYNLLKRFIAFLESLKLPILRKFGRDLLQF